MSFFLSGQPQLRYPLPPLIGLSTKINNFFCGFPKQNDPCKTKNENHIYSVFH